MSKGPGPRNGRVTDYAAGPELSVAALFTILWEALADLLGTAATATLLKRAAKRALARSPELAGLVIKREGLSYHYKCPSAWNDKSEGTLFALRELVGELRPLLVEMTGQIVIQHLEQILELRERGLFAPQEERK
jgi:hypothetical protein